MCAEDGAELPAKFEPFPPELLGRPVEEIDQFVYEKVRNTTKLSTVWSEIRDNCFVNKKIRGKMPVRWRP